MAVDAAAARYAKRQAHARAAKEKKEKIVLAVGGVVLLGLGAFQGPKLLKQLHGSSAAPPPAATAPAAGATPLFPGALPDVSAKTIAKDRAAVRRLGAKDPFVVQVRDGQGTKPDVSQTGAGPHVRLSAFVAKDPFVQQVVDSDTAPVEGSGGGGSTATAGGGSAKAVEGGKYIIVLASVPLGRGRPLAARFAAKARKSGIGSVGVLVSSKYTTLRSGFFVVYAGPYGSLKDTLQALGEVRTNGFVTSYSRRLRK